MKITALFPGSFDPFTIGHKVVVDQGLTMFDKIVVAVGTNMDKKGLLTPQKRVELIKDIFKGNERVEVIIYDTLTGELCRSLGITTIIRGLRNTVDFEYERGIAMVNEKLFPDIQTVLVFTPPRYVAISSSVIRELISYGGDTKQLMPACIDIKNYLE